MRKFLSYFGIAILGGVSTLSVSMPIGAIQLVLVVPALFIAL